MQIFGFSLGIDGLNSFGGYTFHPDIQVLHHVPLFLIIRLQIPLKLRVTQLIPRFEPAIILTITLYRIIGQMNKHIIDIC